MKSANLKVPTVFHHKGTGQDAVCLRCPDGKRRMVYLGGHGSAEAQRRYREVLAEHLAGKPLSTARATREAAAASSWPTVAQLCAAYLLHAEQFYRDEHGHPTGEVTHAAIAFRMLLQLHRDTPTDRVRISDLHAVRQALVDDRSQHEKGRAAPEGLSRRTINDRMARIKRLFRWGVEQGTVAGATWHELSALRGLPKGRCGARDNPAVEAVPWALVEATLPHLVPTIADVVRLQWWSGMRPAEALALTRRQLDVSGPTSTGWRGTRGRGAGGNGWWRSGRRRRRSCGGGYGWSRTCRSSRGAMRGTSAGGWPGRRVRRR